MPNNTNPGRSLDQAVQAGIDAADALDADTRSEADKGYDEAVRTPWNGSEQADSTADQGASRADAGNRQSLDEDDEEDSEAQSLSGGGRASDPTGLETAAGNQQSSS